MKKYIIPSSIVLLIVVGVLLLNFKNTSDEQSVQTNIQEEVKTQRKIETQTNTGELTTDDILSQLDEEVKVIEPEVDENNEPEIVPEPEPKVEPVIVETPKPVVVPEPKPVVATTQPDFQPHEYFRNSEDEAPQVYRYEPKPEWILPNGNPEEFNLDNSEGLSHAYGKNYRNLDIFLANIDSESEILTLEGMTKLIKTYTDEKFYFVGDNEEGNTLWQVHVEQTPEESIALIRRLKSDKNIIIVKQKQYLLPQFENQKQNIIDKHNEYSIF